MVKILSSFALVLLVTACVRTNLTSYTDPQIPPTFQLGKTMVFAGSMPLAERIPVESKFVELLDAEGIEAVRGVDIIPPTQKMSKEQIAQTLMDSEIDQTIVFSGYQKSLDSQYVPQTYTPGTSYSTVNVYGNTGYITTNTTPGYTTGGYTIKKPRFSYDINLHDARSGAILWTASADARGNAFADADGFAHSTAASTITKLKNDGLIKSVNKPESRNTRTSVPCTTDPHFC
ncbi:MAG: hypothetical protein NXI19_09165 [Alphaproteobacteria bacterium]|nr:hypothetical protein [Alphaproteobacteria bacterium]